MVVMTGRIQAKPGGRRELAQALLEWVEAARGADGPDTRLYEDMEGTHAFCIVSEWPDLGSLERHARGQSFGGLVGAIELLAMQAVLTMVTGDGGRFGFRDFRRRAQDARAEFERGAEDR
jgi:quinol monooxygenase YgiN